MQYATKMPGPAGRTPGVMSAVDTLTATVQVLSQDIAQLAERLVPVLARPMQAGGEAALKAGPRGDSAPLEETLRGLHESVTNVVAITSDILDRLEL